MTEKLYGTKGEICEIFGVNIKTLGTDLTEMRRKPEFSDFILRISHRRVLISLQGYEAYLKYKSEARKTSK